MKGEYKEKTFICLGCGKEITKKVPQRHTKYCSTLCYRTSKRPQCLTGNVVICDFCGKEVYKRKMFIIKNKNNFCSRECANKFQARNKIKTVCLVCGKEFFHSLSNPRKYCSLRCRNNDPQFILNSYIKANLIQLHKKGFNRLELLGRELLNTLGLKFKEQVLLFNKFVVDVLLDDYKIIIQWDGDYWHGHERFYPLSERQILQAKKDKSQDNYFSKCGYTVIRFWEFDLKNKREFVNDIIRETVQQSSRAS